MSLEERLSLSSEIENKDLKVNISVCAGYGDDFDKNLIVHIQNSMIF